MENFSNPKTTRTSVCSIQLQLLSKLMVKVFKIAVSSIDTQIKKVTGAGGVKIVGSISKK